MPRHRSSARIVAAYMSFSTGRSPKPFGMILVRRPLLEEQPLQEIRGADHLAVTERKTQVGDAGVEVVEEALKLLLARDVEIVGRANLVNEMQRATGCRSMVVISSSPSAHRSRARRT
jgi:hypothetical protein